MYSKQSFNSLFRAEQIQTASAIAAGAGDNTKVTGLTIDRLGFRSGSILISYETALAEDATLTLAIEIQESDDDSSWDTAVVIQAATVVATGGTGGTTENGVLQIGDQWEARKRYIRYNVTPNLSAGATDTATWSGIVILGDAFEIPPQ